MTSVSCGSSTSTQKSITCDPDNRSKSDASCASNASCFFKRRKPMNPLAYSLRPTYHKANTNTVKQRVMSAKLLKVRQLQSQLNDANYHLAEVARENQALKTLQKRQDKALSKYENVNADLPRLLRSHEEEIRVLTEKNKTFRKTLKELTEQLKQKEEELSRARDQLAHLGKLNRDKHLTEREKLMDSLEDMKIKLEKSEEQVTVLNRKLMLESKISKQRLNAEIVKNKQSQKELVQALEELERLTSLLEAKENVVHPRKQHSKFGNLQSLSMVHLGPYQGPFRNKSCEKLSTFKDPPQNPVTDVKLEPLQCKKDDIVDKSTDAVLKPPLENIKQRLTNGISKNSDELSFSSNDSEKSFHSRDSSAGNLKSRPFSSIRLEKLSKSEEVENKLNIKPSKELPNEELSDNEDDNHTIKTKSDKKVPDKILSSKSEENIENFTTALDDAIKRATENSRDEFDKKLGEYCSEVVNSVNTCSKVIKMHEKGLQSSKDDTETLLETFKNAEKIESKLKKSFLNLDNTSVSFVKDILNEEFKFKVAKAEKETNNRNKQPLVNLENKKRLLATLRAIDNGDSIDSLEDGKQNQANVVKEIFGNIGH